VERIASRYRKSVQRCHNGISTLPAWDSNSIAIDNSNTHQYSWLDSLLSETIWKFLHLKMFQILSPDTILLKWHMMLNFLQKKVFWINKMSLTWFFLKEFAQILHYGICINQAITTKNKQYKHIAKYPNVSILIST